MKKVIAFVSIMVLGSMISLASDLYYGEITVPAGATSASITNQLYRPYGSPCSEIVEVFVTTASGSGTGTVSFANYEYGRTMPFVSSSPIKAGETFYDFPATNTAVRYLSTESYVFATGTVSFVQAVVKTNVAVSVSKYLSRQLVVSVTQGAVTDATVYKWAVYVREDPPTKK